jgi:cysteine desulfurase
MQILDFAYNYYISNKVGPLFHVLKKSLNLSKDELQSLFPNGLLSVYTWVGIPIHSTSEIPCKPLAKIEVDDFREVYFDHNATTYIRDEVKKVLVDFVEGKFGFGNPSSSTSIGKAAYESIFYARKIIADALNVNQDEIYFTASGSEANNLAIKGIAFNHFEKKGHIITSKIEHSSVLHTVQWLESIGFEATYLDVDSEGFISLDELKASIRKNTILIAVMAVNNEIGIINKVNDIGEIASENNIPFLCDAIQAFGKIHLSPKKSGISMMSISGHKIYVPKGIGALYVSDEIKLSPLVHGGGQESGLRSGTENVGYIMALGKGVQLMHEEMPAESVRLKNYSDTFLKRLKEIEPNYVLHGSAQNRIYNNLNIGFPGVDGGALQLSLNNIGVYTSSQSACSSGSKETSHVLKAINADSEHYGTIRFSFGLKSSKEDMDYFFKYLGDILKQLKEA